MLRSRVLLLFAPLMLFFALFAPYALFTSDFRVLIWAIREPYVPFWLLLGINIFGALISGVLLFRLQRIGVRVFEICALITLSHVSYLAMLEKRHGLLVLIFLITALFVLAREWICKTLALPFFQSNREWWEARPKSLPNMRATIVGSQGERQEGLIVSNLGKDGCFVFAQSGRLMKNPAEVSLSIGDRILFNCSVASEYSTSDNMGLGLRFISRGVNTDVNKDMFEFIGLLRRRGYVD